MANLSDNVDRSQINELIDKGEMKQALNQILELDQNDLDIKILKGKLFINNAKYEEALDLSNETLKEATTKQLKFRIFKSSIVKANSLWRLGRVEEAFSILSDESLEIEYTKEDTYEEHQLWLGQYYLMLGNIYHDIGDLDSAIFAYEQSLQIREALGAQREFAIVLNNIGNAYMQKGGLTRAFENYLRAFEINTRINNDHSNAFVLGNLGVISEMQGNYSLAINFIERSKSIFEKMDHKYGIAHSYDNMGKIYYQIGKNSEAIKTLEEGLILKKELKNDILTAYTLYYLVLVSVDNHEIENAKHYYDILKGIGENLENIRVSLYVDMCNALILKYTNRLIDKAEAQKILKSIINQGYIEYEITIYATLHLCDLLILELKQFTDADILNELNHQVEKLFEIAKSQKLNSLLAETYLIKSKLELLLGKIDNARTFLEEAQSIADENGYLRIAIQISNNFDKLLESSDKIENLISKHSTLNERFQIADVEDLFLNMVRKRTTEINLTTETAVGLYVVNKENKPIYLREFTSNINSNSYIDWVVGLKRSRAGTTRSEGLLERFRYRNYTAVIKFENESAYCYVFEGQSYSAKQKLDRLIETLKLDKGIWDIINNSKETLSTELLDSINQIVLELFDIHQEPKEIRSELPQPKNLPDSMVMFKDYLHPVRLWILKVMASSFRMSRLELAQVLSVNSGTLTRHLELLTANELVRQEKEFVDDKPRIVYYLEPKGTQLYNEIKHSLLEAFV